MSGVTGGTTLNPGQTATLNVTFDPTTASAATGSVTITTNASSGGTVTINLTGTGTATTYQVNLTWQAPTSSSDPVAGYNIYRSTSGGAFQLLNSSVNTPTSYSDTTVQNGSSYTYQVTSVDSQGNESSPSNTYTATIP
jgi:fibronectin type 3 domain-containing protein